MLPLTVSVRRNGRWSWTVWATTIPAGGTRVDVYRRRTYRGAVRKGRRILAAQERNRRWAHEEVLG